MRTLVDSLAASLEEMLTQNNHLVKPPAEVQKLCGIVAAFSYHFIMCNIAHPDYLQATADQLNHWDQEETKLWYVNDGTLDYHSVIPVEPDTQKAPKMFTISKKFKNGTTKYLTGFQQKVTINKYEMIGRTSCWGKLPDAIAYHDLETAQYDADLVNERERTDAVPTPFLEKDLEKCQN